jgi:hypothetical protein
LSLVVSSAGCGQAGGILGKYFSGPAPAKFSADRRAPEAQPVAPEQVRVYDIDGHLPSGVVVEDRRVLLEGDYPTAEAPHRYLGDASIRGDLKKEVDRQEMIARLVDEVAKHGANTLVIRGCGPEEQCEGVALLLSSATPNTDYPTAAELLAGPPKDVVGSADTEVSPVSRDLSEVEPLTLEVKRGRCYALGLALEKDAALSGRARQLISVQTTQGDAEGSREMASRIPRSKRVFSTKLGCPESDGTMKLEIVAPEDAENVSLFNLGKGAASVVVYSWAIDEQQLVERKRAREEGAAIGKQRDAERRSVCALCRRVKQECQRLRTGADCMQKESSCIRVNGLHDSDCI